MLQPNVLWICSTDSLGNPGPRIEAETYFKLLYCDSLSRGIAAAQASMPDVVCFEFDDPSAQQLRAMRDFKLTHPSIPILMLTTQHSEELAIWAFRNRVWNYLVKPVAASELRANYRALVRLVAEPQGRPRALVGLNTLLPSEIAEPAGAVRAPGVSKAVLLVEQGYAQRVRQRAVATQCNMTSSTFSRAFKAEYGLTFSEFLLRYRVSRACRLLRRGTHNATTAGLSVGFDDPSHFARAFRRVLGTSPSVWQSTHPAEVVPLERRRRPRAVPGKRALNRTALQPQVAARAGVPFVIRQGAPAARPTRRQAPADCAPLPLRFDFE